MDSWSEKQIQSMRVGGNDRCNQFLEKYGFPKNTPIARKYNTQAAAFYRNMIAAAAEGLPVPTPPDSFEEGVELDPVQLELKKREEVSLNTFHSFFFSLFILLIIIFFSCLILYY
jgi:hypothetical protein